MDPPLTQSPLPDSDDLQFLNVQFNTTLSKLELDKVNQLRVVGR